MFKINKNTRLYSDGVSNSFKNKIIVACAASLLLSGVAYADNKKDNIEMMRQQLENRTSVFANFTNNQKFTNEANNAVMVVMTSNSEDTVNWGSGVVVANSGNERNKYNRILTTAASVNPNQAYKTNKHFDNNILIFNSSGNLIATGTVEAQGDFNKIHGEDRNESIQSNLAVIKVNSITERFKQIKGAELSNNITKTSFNFTIKEGIGSGPGIGGSPVYDSYGKLAGIASSYNYDDTNNMQVIYKAMLEDKVYKVNVPETVDGDNAVSDANLKGNLMMAVPKESNINVASLNNDSILKALNKAGENVKIVNQAPKTITMFGYTCDVGVFQEATTEIGAGNAPNENVKTQVKSTPTMRFN